MLAMRPFAAGSASAQVAHRAQPREDLLAREPRHRLHGVVATREGVGPAAVRALAREQVRRDGDEAVGGELVGDGADPVGESEDLVDDDHHRRLVLTLGIDDPGPQRPAGRVDRDELTVPRRRVEPFLGALLARRQRRGPDGDEQPAREPRRREHHFHHADDLHITSQSRSGAPSGKNARNGRASSTARAKDGRASSRRRYARTLGNASPIGWVQSA